MAKVNRLKRGAPNRSSKVMNIDKLPMKLTAKNYYNHKTDWQYMSVSLFKEFEQCEARTLAILKGKWQPIIIETPLLVGNYVHSKFESADSHRHFIRENREKIMTKPTKKYPEGHLRSEFKVADNMIECLKNDQMFTNYYTPGQKEVIVVGKIDGYWWKGKIDSLVLDKNYFCDLKTVDDIHKGHWDSVLHKYIPFIQAREYDLQMAVYEELVKQSFNKICQPYIFAVSKQTPPDKIAIDFTGTDDEYSMKTDLEKIKELQPHFWSVLNGEEAPNNCGKCDYCRKIKQLSNFTHATEIELN